MNDQDPRIPKPRALPASLQPKGPDAPEKPKADPPPRVSDELAAYLLKHFPEKAYTPELVSTERLWFDQGTRVLAMHLVGLNTAQKESV